MPRTNLLRDRKSGETMGMTGDGWMPKGHFGGGGGGAMVFKFKPPGYW
jgi:hypothetical protein